MMVELPLPAPLHGHVAAVLTNAFTGFSSIVNALSAMCACAHTHCPCSCASTPQLCQFDDRLPDHIIPHKGQREYLYSGFSPVRKVLHAQNVSVKAMERCKFADALQYGQTHFRCP
ncbi:hypothetical protein KCP78_05850 [Salmonella enterica subsp. enterica]|nr:hypothetical protein KCP78_05850 [Salmonella enterica subsp. enterica]